MNMKEKQTMANKAKIRTAKVKRAQDFAKNAVISVEDVKDAIQGKAAAAKGVVAHASQQADRGIRDVRDTAGVIKDDIKHGAGEISKDVHRTADSVSKELHHSKK